jgi:predicted HTH transcriptional regulator
MVTDHIDLDELARRENEQVEWKENVADVDDVAATLSAFANDLHNLGGGYVVCGVAEVQDEHGFPTLVRVGLTAERLKEVEGKVLTRCREQASPPITPLVAELPADDPQRRILVFVQPATGSAHTFRRRNDGAEHYVRVSRSTFEARNGVLKNLLVRKGALESWDQLLDAQSYTIFDKADPAAPNVRSYPKRALYEVMGNALAHRDYELIDPTRLTVFADRVDVASPGPLPPGVDLESLRNGTAPPRWRNQALAWFFTRLQLAQAEGQGVPTILRSMREEGNPPPSFNADQVRVVCTLPAHPRRTALTEQFAERLLVALTEARLAADRLDKLRHADPSDTEKQSVNDSMQAHVESAPRRRSGCRGYARPERSANMSTSLVLFRRRLWRGSPRSSGSTRLTRTTRRLLTC